MSDRIFGDEYRSNKQYMYYVEFITTVESISDIEEIKDMLYGFDYRMMNAPTFVDEDGKELTIRIDFEEIEEASPLAEILYDNEAISSDEYMNFEENVIEYE